MKLFEKLKNALFEEEYVEVEETPKKKEKVTIAKKIDLPEKNVEIPKEFVREPEPIVEEEKLFTDRDLLKTESSFRFPMDFEEEDFKEELVIEEPPRPEVKQVEKPKPYQNSDYQKPEYTFHEYGTYEKKEEKKIFRPSPIISPIYGVLDQNYKKEEIVQKKEVRITSSYATTRLDFDAVREKAYGDLSNEIGLSMSEKEKEELREEQFQDEIEDNLLFDMRDEDTTPSIDKVTMGDAEEYFQDLGLEYNIDYKDARKERATGRRVSRVKEVIDEKPEPKEEIINDKLEDNLFDLIDSMYDEER